MSKVSYNNNHHFYSRRAFASSNSRRFKLPENFDWNAVFVVGSLVCFIAALTVMTLIFSTKHFTKGNVLSSLDSDNKILQKEVEVSDMEISKVRALNFIKDSPKVDAMVYPREVVYVEGQTAIAKR